MDYTVGEPFFLKGHSRRLFVLKFHANPEVTFKGLVLHLPAFGEEMNKSRAMVAKQARALAIQGYQVMIPDYYGSGDSGGDFSEATWALWLEDMHFCLSHMQESISGPTILWGLRLGALMAIELSSAPRFQAAALLMWNPVLNGEQHMLQFLRLRLMNSMMYSDTKEKVADLKAILEEEGVLEVAGYELSKEMFSEVCARSAAKINLPNVHKVFWSELSPSEKTLPMPAQKLMEQWQIGGIDIHIERVIGPQFWATQEISKADALIDVTIHWLGETNFALNTNNTEII